MFFAFWFIAFYGALDHCCLSFTVLVLPGNCLVKLPHQESQDDLPNAVYDGTLNSWTEIACFFCYHTVIMNQWYIAFHVQISTMPSEPVIRHQSCCTVFKHIWTQAVCAQDFLHSWLPLCVMPLSVSIQAPVSVPADMWDVSNLIFMPGLARMPLVNSYARTPPLVWKMGWMPSPIGDSRTRLPPLSLEFLQEKDVLKEFIFRVNVLGTSFFV